MKGLLHAASALLLAVVATVALAVIVPRAQDWIDFFLIATVYYAITRSRTTGLWMGAACGLTADVLTSQVLGFQAFVKTAMAYLVGRMGARFMLDQPFPQILALLLATLLDGAVAALLSFMSGLPVVLGPGTLLWRSMCNSLLGLMIYRVAGRQAGPSGFRGS
ncbi:MAG: rod shape-determining protein MreD [Acidobacteriota bacterium]